MNTFARTLIAISALSSALCAQAADWQPTKQRDGVQLYARKDQEKTSLEAFKGVIKVRASMKQVLAAVLVRETFHEWIHNMLEDRTLTEDNADQSYCYMWIKGVWPTSDRDAVARVTVKQDASSLAVSVVAESRKEYQDRVPKQQGRVRMSYMYSGFTVVPVSAGETEVQLEGVADPEGNIPDWLTNQVADDLPVKTLSALKARLESGKVDLTALETNPFAQLAMQKIQLPKFYGQ